METLALSDGDRDLIRSLIIADPALVLGDDQVMQRLVGETTGERRIVDLRDRLVQRLERRLERLVHTHKTVIEAAYENVAGTQELHAAVLALIEPPDLSAFLYRLLVEVPAMLRIEEARLCLETDVTTSGPALVLEAAEGRVIEMHEGGIADYLGEDGADGRQVVMREVGEEAEIVFGEANPVQSEACLRLDIAGGLGLLVLGSADPAKFEPSHGSDLLVFFAGVIERLLMQRISGEDDAD